MSEDSNEKTPSLSRRDFLRVVSLGAATAVIPKKIATLLSADDSSNLRFKENQEFTEQGLQILPEIQIGNLSVTPILTEHTHEAWNDHGQQVLRAIEPFSTVIPEYLPDEYEEELKKNAPLSFQVKVSGFERQNELFYHVSEFCRNKGKELWMVDPAYSDAMAYFRARQYWPVGVLAAVYESVLAAGILKFENNPIKRDSESVNLQSQRNRLLRVLSYGAMAMLPLTVGDVVISQFQNNTEIDLRHTLISEALVQLGDRLPPGSRAAILYPAAHWTQKSPPGISEYLSNPAVRMNALRKYGGLKEKTIFNPLFQVRHYEAKNNQWQKLPGFSINTK